MDLQALVGLTTMRLSQILAMKTVELIIRIRKRRKRTRRRIRRNLPLKMKVPLLKTKGSLAPSSINNNLLRMIFHRQISLLSRTRLARAFSKIKTPAKMKECLITRLEVTTQCTLVKFFSIDT